MFGFLRPAKRIHEWRQSYARICQTQRRMFGLTSLPFLNYEATFLYQLTVDADLIPRLSDDAPECCRLRRLRNFEQQPDRQVAEFCAAFGMLLAGIKLQDDADDHQRWHNRLALWKYSKQVRKARQHLQSVCPHMLDQVQEILEAHRQTEQAGHYPSIEDYSRPTGDGFALVFRTLASTIGGTVEQFEFQGRCIGQAIVSWDCAVDFERDRIYGEFNPLRNVTDVANSLMFCQLQLARAGWNLSADAANCQRVIQSAATRVYARLHQSDNYVCRTTLLERWGLVRAKGYQYARCDGCEAACMVGECGECAAAGAGGAVEGAGAGTSCCCDSVACCYCPGTPCDGGSPAQSVSAKQTTEQPSVYEQYQSREGVAVGDLNPEGFVMIDDVKLPAKSDGGFFIADQTAVRIVETGPLGVTIRPLR